MTSLTRRRFTQGMLASSGAALTMPALTRPAFAADRLLIVQWGAMWIDVSRQILDKYLEETGSDVRVAWEQHSGGAAAILARIQAEWPNTQRNMISAWDPVFRSMMNEDWLEPVDESIVTNLADIPDLFVQKDAEGRAMTVPLSTAGAFWGYREDLLPNGFDSIEDLLRPEFRGQLCIPYPINLTGLFIVTCAIQRGGDEFNVEPGWEFVKELAASGAIGQICTSNSEFINAMATNQFGVGFWNNGGWFATAENFPVVIKNRMPDNKGFLYNEGFCVLKGSPLDAAWDLANFFARPDINELYNMGLGSGPTHPDAKANPLIADWFYEPEELDEFAYVADFDHLGSVMGDWNERWETEVLPLIP